MTSIQKNEASLTVKKAFEAVGLKWEGTFAEAGEGSIHAVQRKLQDRIKEIPYVLNTEIMLGLSYHADPKAERFIHYAVVEVERTEEIPNGMVTVSVPTLSYATCKHVKNQKVDQSYKNIYSWIKKQGYQKIHVDGLTHFEQYPMQQDLSTNDLEFIIMIPVLDPRNM